MIRKLTPDQDNVYKIDDFLYEKQKQGSLLEASIKAYQANKANDLTVYMVFLSLAKERVFLPCNEDGALVSLSVNGQNMIAVFSREERMDPAEPINLKPAYLRDYINSLIDVGLPLFVNPFCEEDLQFLVPYEALEKMLLPIIREEMQSGGPAYSSP